MNTNKLPSFEELFGNLDFTNTDESRSVLSPAAYLVDIMNLKDWKYDDHEDAVDDRRDDISEIPLNAGNTTTEIPYLDIVNRVMEKRIISGTDSNDAYDILRKARFPFNLPYNHYKTQIKKILEYFKTDPMRFYESFTASPDSEIAAREYLGLSIEEFQAITTPSNIDGDVSKFYGIDSVSTLSKVTEFRKATELSVFQLIELIYQNLSDDERSAGTSRRFFINCSSSSPGIYLTIDTSDEGTGVGDQRLRMSDGITSIPIDYFDRIHRFIRLSRNTGLSFIELDQILVTACSGILDNKAIEVIAGVKWIRDKCEIPVDEICAFFSGLKDYGKGEKTESVDLFNRVFNNGYGNNVCAMNLSTEKAAIKIRLQACLECNEDEYDAIIRYLHDAGKELQLDPLNLALLYRIKKLAMLLELPVSSLFILFRIIDRNYALLSEAKFRMPFPFLQTIRNCRDIITGDVSTIRDTLWLIQLTLILTQWLVENEMTVEQLEFICLEHSNSLAEGVLSSEETRDLFSDLKNQFDTVVLKAETLQSGIIDSVMAMNLFQKISEIETGICTDRGIIKKIAPVEQLLPVYKKEIREKLLVEKDDFAVRLPAGTPEDTDEDPAAYLDELFLFLKNNDYLDADGYITESHADFFMNPNNSALFLPERFALNSEIVFKTMSGRVKIYKGALENENAECQVIAEKIKAQSERQKTVLFRTLESSLNISFDIVEILCNTIFRTIDEIEQMAVVRFMTFILEAYERQDNSGELRFDASLATSFRRLQQFALLVSKTELRARELETLFTLKKVQDSMPEKLKLPSGFPQKIDAMYGDSENNVYIFSGNRYIRFSGADYAQDAIGNINELPGIPPQFSTGINAGLRDQGPDEKERKTYIFSGEKYIDTESPDTLKSTKEDWGNVRNNIAVSNSVDAAYLAPDGKAFLFSGDQYIRYSGLSRDYADEGYPKRIKENWNSENQIRLPFEIRERIDSVFTDSDDSVCFFSKDRFVSSRDPGNVLHTNEYWGKVANNIASDCRIDAALVIDGKTYLFRGDQYVRYSSPDYSHVDEGYPKKITGNWNKEGIIPVAGEYEKGITAAFKGVDNRVYIFNGSTFIDSQNNAPGSEVKEKWGKVLNNIRQNNRVDAALAIDGKTYLFCGDQYIRYSDSDYSHVDEGYPKKIAGNWNAKEKCGTLPDDFTPGISAALTSQDNNVYFFRGNQYISSKAGASIEQVNNHWGRVRSNIESNNRIDAAFRAPDGKTYVFCGDQYYRYSGSDYSFVDEGYPGKIKGNWGNLPDAFCNEIDNAFVFKVNDINRLYLFSGNAYVRYSGSYTEIDPGYPKQIDMGPNPEGHWFDPIFELHPYFPHHIHKIATIFVDMYNNKERINYFYYENDGKEELIKYEYDGKTYRWSNPVLVSGLPIAPFTSVDAGFMGADNKVYLFSGNSCATLIGNYIKISQPVQVKDFLGKSVNRFQELNRVDTAFKLVDGPAYLFCDNQYVRYSGEIKPEGTDFFVDEGYPKKISENWEIEKCNIPVPASFDQQGCAILAAPSGPIFVFTGGTFIYSENSVSAAINETWGKVRNNFEAFNKVDAGFVHQNKTFLFCGDQYIRYSGNYDSYADEGYPKKINRIEAEDGIAFIAMFPNGIDAIMDGADGITCVFSGDSFVSSSDPSVSGKINGRFGIVRNVIADTGLIDAADLMKNGGLYLFSGDQYVRYSTNDRSSVDEGYPKAISNWKNFEPGDLPLVAKASIKAVFRDSDGETYFFKDDSFFALSNPAAIAQINSKWGKVKNNFGETGCVDAAFIAPDGRTYLFSGNQFTRYSKGKNDYADEGYPKLIGDNWGSDLPADYKAGIDAGFVFDGRTYFFKGDTFVRYSDPACKKIDTGFPRPMHDTMSELPEIRLDDVKDFQQLKELAKKFSDPDHSLVQYLESDSDPQHKELSLVTGWKEEEIAFLSGSGALSASDYHDIQVLSEMKVLFEFSEKMGVLPSTLYEEAWDKIYGTGTAYKEAAGLLEGFLKTMTGMPAWNGLSAELHNKMNLVKRDACLGYLIHKLELENGTEWIKNPRDLYEYLLLDVEMGEEAITSRIQEALMCMQLFYHRTLMNLEQEEQTTKDLKEKLKAWWVWMKNYRVWEANRKVFLYPENYIRPELRTDKSPAFKELEEALLQGDITRETAEKTFHAFLDKYSEVSRLKIAGGYIYQRPVISESDDVLGGEVLNEKKVLVFGYSRTEPKKYYQMTGEILENGSIDWPAWKELNIQVNADAVYPVYAFNRVFVFWVEITERDQTVFSGGSVGPDNNITMYKPVFYYSFYNLKNEWVAPQKMLDLGDHIDQLEPNKRRLFIDDKNKKKAGAADYIPAKQILEGARFYVTNPITSRYYNAEEFVYLSYEVRFAIPNGSTIEFTLEGKIKPDLEFEQGSADVKILDKLEKNIQFPIAKFGITPVSFSHWKGFFNDSFSAPWFSFNANGGSFLCKPLIVPDAPILITDKKCFGHEWENLPDTGFTDKNGRIHLFYRKNNGASFYRYVDEQTKILSEEEPVTNRWGNRNILVSYDEGIVSVARKGEKTFMLTTGRRCLTYTGSGFVLIDQDKDNQTTTLPSMQELLPGNSQNVTWHRVKEDLQDYLDSLLNAFVCNGSFYLVAEVDDDSSGKVKEYTCPQPVDFFSEISLLIPDKSIADTVRTWDTIRAADLFEQPNIRRLYITSGNYVLIRDYDTQTYSLRTVIELTHPDVTASVSDPMPAGAIETIWNVASLYFDDFINRLSGISTDQGNISFIARKDDASYEYISPTVTEFFAKVAEAINDPVIAATVGSFAVISSAQLFSSGSIRRLYIRSEENVVMFDYGTHVWSVDTVVNLTHPDVTATVPSTTGHLPPNAPNVGWKDVAESLEDFLKALDLAFVWDGAFFLVSAKYNGNQVVYEYTSPTPAQFWQALGETIPQVKNYKTVDAACVATVNGIKQLYVACKENVALCNLATGQWSSSTIRSVWNVDFKTLTAIFQAPDDTLYLFSDRTYAEPENDTYVTRPLAAKWGRMRNILSHGMDSAFMDGENRIYIFTGDEFIRYSDLASGVIDRGYPKTTLTDLGIDLNDVKAQFSADINNVYIHPDDLFTNTAFVQNVNGVEKMYLFLNIKATIARYVWKWRWVWFWHWLGWGWWHWYWWGWWIRQYYLVVEYTDVVKSVFIRFTRNGENFTMDDEYPKVITGNWSNLPGDFNNMITATFEDEEGEGENKKSVFYAFKGNDYVKYTGIDNFPREISEEKYEIVRLTSNTSEALKQKLFLDGIDGLLNIPTQETNEIPRFIVSDQADSEDPSVHYDNRGNDVIPYKPAYIARVPQANNLDFGSVNARYYWEIFFHAPFLVAQAFNNAQKFEEANGWYEYIFDPTESYDGEHTAFWKFMPFHWDIDGSIEHDLNDMNQYRKYLNDPFDPHAIARLRQIAYRKSIVMSYIDNLIDWGDMLFRQYTRETINEARMLYVLAYDLLGKKPELLGTKKLTETKTYRQLKEQREMNAALLALENAPFNAAIPVRGIGATPNDSLLDPYGYFHIPENKEFIAYWERIEDRLHKIRYSLNIEGIKQRLPLFEPPIDVMALVKAVGSGAGLAQALADFNVAVPHYRFNFIMAKARELTARITQFGQSLLSTLEKKDAEELSLLRNTHENAILQMTLDIKNSQVKDSEETVKSLKANLKGAKTRETHYTRLLAENLSPYEITQISLLIASQVFSVVATGLSTAASIGSFIPQLGSPFSIQHGGLHIGQGLQAGAGACNALSGMLSMGSNLASILGGFHRRSQDWTLQKQLASCDIENIEHQIAGAEIKVKIAQQEIELAKKNIKNNESVDTFMKGKFTNSQLYRWMAGKLSGLYFQTYQMALDMAKAAQRSFQFELGLKESEVSFITAMYWDSLKKGLLTGETLQVDLDRMEKAYLEKNRRRFEISKTVSLAQLDPLALLALREKRVCEFTLAEALFDYDFPGHYCRQIKSVSLTFPAVAGPYENINATLTQLSHRTLLEPDKAGVEYMLSPTAEIDQPLSIRADWRINQQIALSRGVNDSGLFQLNFQDERYLPFEGTGAISTWRLELNGHAHSFDVSTLSDVIIKIEYTALQGGEAFAATVRKKLKSSPEAKLFNLAQEFSSEWNRFMNDPARGLAVTMTAEMFPDIKGNKVTGLYMVYIPTKEGADRFGDVTMKMNSTIELKNASLKEVSLSISPSGTQWKLVPKNNSEDFTPENITNIGLVCLYEKKAEF